ncbi:MAG TPA: hypothetical protein VF203_13995 [Burkholderiales bacterium]
MNGLKRNIAAASVCLVSAVSAAGAYGAEPSMKPQAIVTQAQAALYPVAFNNVQGLVSTLILTTVSEQGSYLVCRDLTDQNCVALDVPAGVSAHTMDELGVAAGGVSLLAIIAADANTQGVASLVVQSQAGGIDFPPSYTLSNSNTPAPGESPSP